MSRAFSLIAIAIVMATMVGCTGNKVYSHYQHTLISGWEKNDILTFSVPSLKESGTYSPELMLRINGSYPFMGVTMIVEQKKFPSQETRIDTLKCSLIDDKGNTKGQGLSYYQYSFPIEPMQLAAGNSLQVSIRHNMKREILPGISDVGYSLSLH